MFAMGQYHTDVRARHAFIDMFELANRFFSQDIVAEEFVDVCLAVSRTTSHSSSDVCIYPRIFDIIGTPIYPEDESTRFSEQFIYDSKRLEKLVSSLEKLPCIEGETFLSKHYGKILVIAKRALAMVKASDARVQEQESVTEKRWLRVTTCTKYNHETGFYESFEVTGQMPKELINKLLEVIRQETGK